MNNSKVTQIISQHANHVVEITGFESADSISHMIKWLRRGSDFRQFIVQDVETELYVQQPQSQLISLSCGVPETETNVRKSMFRSTAAVTGVSITFPLTASVCMSDRVFWNLQIKLNYKAFGLDQTEKFKHSLNFLIENHEIQMAER